MSYVEYEKAQKAGLKAFKAAVSKGENEYLPVLDEILEGVEIQGEVNLGLVQIPLDRVVGTSNVGRTYAFANNFMPILDYKTEFGGKWSALCDAQIEEGIRDPIKVYEYLNKFYVVEGNKRVSVLKFFDCPTVAANVTRKVPKLTEEKEIKIYYDFMDFYKLTDINYIWFEKEGCFRKLLELTCDNPDEPWTGEQKKDFGSFNHNFQVAFKSKGGDKLDISPCEALLIFIDICGYEKIKNLVPSEIEEKMSAVWTEFAKDANEDVELTMEPGKKAKKNIIEHLRGQGNKRLMAAFIYDKDPQESDWLYGHELGRMYLDENCKDRVRTFKVHNLNSEEETIEAMEDLITMGVNVMFTTSSQQLAASLKVAASHPDIAIFNCSLNSSYKLVTSYYARLYEVKFLAGMMAGALTENGKIGYLADYPIVGMTANINAFALGAQMVNPHAKVYLEWTTVKGLSREAAIENFKANNIYYVSDQIMMKPTGEKKQFGLYCIEEDGVSSIATPVYQWGVFYEKIIDSIQSGAYQRDKEKKAAVNYWWGLSSGVVDLIYSRKIPDGILRLMRVIKGLIKDNAFSPFSDTITDQSGVVRNSEKESMLPEDIMNMDWLVSNVVGEIPEIDKLKDEARGIVELKGVSKSN